MTVAVAGRRPGHARQGRRERKASGSPRDGLCSRVASHKREVNMVAREIVISSAHARRRKHGGPDAGHPSAEFSQYSADVCLRAPGPSRFKRQEADHDVHRLRHHWSSNSTANLPSTRDRRQLGRARGPQAERASAPRTQALPRAYTRVWLSVMRRSRCVPCQNRSASGQASGAKATPSRPTTTAARPRRRNCPGSPSMPLSKRCPADLVRSGPVRRDSSKFVNHEPFVRMCGAGNPG